MICCFSSLFSSNAPRRTKRRFEFLAFILLQLLVSCLSDGPAASKQQSLHQASSSGGKKASEPEGLFSSQCFSGLKMHARLVSALESKFNAVQMTPIQALSCPVLIRSSCDALIRAPTGSGKTLAYAVPLVQKLQEREEAVGRKDGPYVMILTPTRELAVQTYEVISKLLRSFVWIVPGILTGGEKPKSEKARLRKGVNVLVVTPARLTYHIRNTNSLSLCKMETIVMDECDMLLDLGYARDIDVILDAITQASEKVKVGGRIQHILLSATLSPGVTKLANRSLYKPKFFSAGGGGGGGLTPLPPLSRSKTSKDCGEDGDEDDDNEQIQNSNDAGNRLNERYSLPESLRNHALIVPMEDRLVALAALLKLIRRNTPDKFKILVFCSCVDSVDFHYELFAGDALKPVDETENDDGEKTSLMWKKKLRNHRDKERGIPVMKEEKENQEGGRSKDKEEQFYKLHGEMPFEVRKGMLQDFSSQRKAVLFTTDVAARGLDFPKISWVIQYNTPSNPTEFVHRAGRAGRMGATGDCILLLLPEEARYTQILTGKGVHLDAYRLPEVFDKALMADYLKERQKAKLDQKQRRQIVAEVTASMQKRFEDFTLRHPNVHETARKAFLSYLRAYTVRPKELRDVFNISGLHYGKVAKSFSLRESPKVAKEALLDPSSPYARKQISSGRGGDARRSRGDRPGRQRRGGEEGKRRQNGPSSGAVARKRVSLMERHLARRKFARKHSGRMASSRHKTAAKAAAIRPAKKGNKASR